MKNNMIFSIVKSPQLFLSLLLFLGLCLVGCGDLPFAKKSPPPVPLTEPAFEPPPPLPPPAPLEPAPAAAPAPRPAYASGGSNPADARLADLASQFEALRARLQAVEGKLAEQENQLQQLARSGNPQQAQLQDKVTALQRDLAAAQERLSRQEGLRPAPTAAARPESPPAIREIAPPRDGAKTSGDPFQEGAALYKQKSYGPAKEKLQQFLQEHPRGDKAVEARYYLADSLLHEKKYDEAIVEFSKVVDGSPKSPFAPPALLKQAQAFKAQGKSKVSNLVLEKLMADYPKSPEALQARKLAGESPPSPEKKKGR